MGRLNGQCGASLACKSTTCRVIGSLCFEEGSGGRSRPMSKNDTPSDKNTWSSIQISDSKKKRRRNMILRLRVTGQQQVQCSR